MKNLYYKKIYLLIGIMVIVSTSHAVPLLLTHEPLFLNQSSSVPPALAITFDDSGSMAWSWMPDSRNFVRNRPSFASSDYNLIYYNPNINYTPPLRADGSSFPDSDFANARPDGYYIAADFIDRVNLNSEYRVFNVYRPFYDSQDGATNANVAGASYDLSFASVGRGTVNTPHRAYYYSWTGPANADLLTRRDSIGGYTLNEITTVQEKQNFANWYSYYNNRSKLAKASVSIAFNNFGPDFKIDWQQINQERFGNKTNTNMQIFDAQHREDFFEWLYLIPSIGLTPLRRATQEAGEIFKDADVYADARNTNNTIELSCQQNFHIAISDGSWNDEAGIVTNEDGVGTTLPDGTIFNPSSLPGKMYNNPESGTLADTAFYYWATDLRTPTGDVNNVPTFIDDYTDSKGKLIILDQNDDWKDNSELYWNPRNNPASWQHMVNFNVGLGIEGTFNQMTDLPGLRDGSLSWPETRNRCFDIGNTEIPCRFESCRVAGNWSTRHCARASNVIESCAWRDNDGIWSNFNCAERAFVRNNPNGGRVDDVWHASLNSRGDYFSARDPQELAVALYNVVSGIIQRTTGRASVGSVSSSIISANALAFKTGYDSSDWSGFVTAAPINNDGTTGDVIWDAACKLTGGECITMLNNPIVAATNTYATRNIFTYDYDSQFQHEFQTINMSLAEQAKILDSTFITQSIINGNNFSVDDIVQYVRGNRSYEKQNGGKFRNRRSLLSDVIHSPAKIIRGPAASFNDSLWYAGTLEKVAANGNNGYEEFRTNNIDRDNILLVGANDGMLHAFDAGINTNNGGNELWAYIPSKALDGISSFVDPAYIHKTYVDSSPFIGDAFINGGWSTVALGGMRHGGKLFYALDLGNNPKDVPSVLWEFTDETDNDMGFSYAGAVIANVIVPNGSLGVQTKWVAFLPNGYNSQNHKSVMFAVDLETGQLLHKWDSGIGDNANPNGMGPAVAGDFIGYDNNGNSQYTSDQGADFIYAGDLHGNLYRFDLREIFSSATVTTPDIIYNGSTNRPITIAPRLFSPKDGSENIIVTFGTGKYIELPDRGISGSSDQYLIGLKDSEISRVPFSLVDSRLIEQNIATTGNFRTFSSNLVGVDEGWKVRLPQLGERIVNSLIRNNQAQRLIVSSIIPNQTGLNPCETTDGGSWLMVVDARTGGMPINGRALNGGESDGLFVNKILTGANVLTTAGGNKTILNIDDTGSGQGGGETDSIILNYVEKWRRRSWHRILFD